MTTRVTVSMPTPNHKRAKVDLVDINPDGTDGSVRRTWELGHGESTPDHTLYVHSGAKIVITEIE